MKKILLVALLVPVLAACNTDKQYPVQDVSFATHPSVLRGTYTGQFSGGEYAGKTLTLAFTPAYATATSYTYTATGTLADMAVTSAGTVSSTGTFNYIRSQATAIPTLSTQLTLKQGTETKVSFLPCLARYDQPTVWNCNGDSTTLTLTKKN